MIAHQKKLKFILEGIENKKWLKILDGLKYDVDQYVMVTMDFTPSPVYRHLQIYCYLWWVLVLVFSMVSVMCFDWIWSMSNYVDGLQSIPQVKDINEIIYGHVCTLSDIWIYFFY